MAMINKNQKVHGGQNPFFLPDSDCLPKYNYSTGAGWKTRKGATIGHMLASRAFDVKRKKRDRGLFT